MQQSQSNAGLAGLIAQTSIAAPITSARNVTQVQELTDAARLKPEALDDASR